MPLDEFAGWIVHAKLAKEDMEMASRTSARRSRSKTPPPTIKPRSRRK